MRIERLLNNCVKSKRDTAVMQVPHSESLEVHSSLGKLMRENMLNIACLTNTLYPPSYLNSLAFLSPAPG